MLLFFGHLDFDIQSAARKICQCWLYCRLFRSQHSNPLQFCTPTPLQPSIYFRTLAYLYDSFINREIYLKLGGYLALEIMHSKFLRVKKWVMSLGRGTECAYVGAVLYSALCWKDSNCGVLLSFYDCHVLATSGAPPERALIVASSCSLLSHPYHYICYYGSSQPDALHTSLSVLSRLNEQSERYSHICWRG